MSRLQCVTVGLGGPRLMTEECFRCKTIFAMAMPVYEAASQRKEGMLFWCPNGHQQSYVTGESETAALRRERDRLKQQMARAEEEKREALALADKSDRALKRHKKRSAAGTCPCCQRTFANMAQHMKREHPAFVRDTGAKIIPIKGGAAA